MRKGKKQIYFSNLKVEHNAILEELETFADAINTNSTPTVTLEQATEALRVAYQIIDCFKNRTLLEFKVKRENFKIKIQ
jgi:predicted dehydrogenase